MRLIDIVLLVAASLMMLVAPWQSEFNTKAEFCGCAPDSSETPGTEEGEPEEGEPEEEPPARTTANIRITALENHWGWKKDWEFKLEAVDGSYRKSVAVTAETTKKFQHLFTDVPLGKALIFYTPSQIRSYTYYAFQLPKDNTETFELTGTGFSYPCGMTTCIEWTWMASWLAS